MLHTLQRREDRGIVLDRRLLGTGLVPHSASGLRHYVGELECPEGEAGGIVAQKGAKTMAAIAMVTEDQASGKVGEIYADIKASLGIDFVPNLYKVMAVKPEYLEANWNKVKAVMVTPGKLDRLTKEIIAVAVSAVNACVY